VATEEKLKIDPTIASSRRGPASAWTANWSRDYALAASGLLNNMIGGPSVKPYQPDGVWETVAMLGSNTRHYNRDSGDKLYRRSLYTFWKRSAPPASMEIFNAPSREACTVRPRAAPTLRSRPSSHERCPVCRSCSRSRPSVPSPPADRLPPRSRPAGALLARPLDGQGARHRPRG